jgi:hypothetical protein
VPLARGAGIARGDLRVAALGRELRLTRTELGAWTVEITGEGEA